MQAFDATARIHDRQADQRQRDDQSGRQGDHQRSTQDRPVPPLSHGARSRPWTDREPATVFWHDPRLVGTNAVSIWNRHFCPRVTTYKATERCALAGQGRRHDEWAMVTSRAAGASVKKALLPQLRP